MSASTDPDPPPADLVQLLDPQGRRREHPEFIFTGDDAQIAAWYRDLVLLRRFDTEATALQRHGELGLWAPCLGQEAAQIGAGRALRDSDHVFPTYREHGIAWCRDIDPVAMLGLFRGTDLGGWDPEEHRYALPAIVIGAQTLHATGYAMGLMLDGRVGHDDPDRDAAVLACFGDGASSQGDVNEAFGFAASFAAPVVFFCQNNHWAISVPAERQSRIPIARRADGFGFRGIRIDGNDLLACHAVVRQALDEARAGNGPVLVEAVTYRMGAHTTSDDPGRYRDEREVEAWAERDPIARVRAYLESAGVAPDFFAEVDGEADELGASVREGCRSLPEPDLATFFDRVGVQLDPELMRQRTEYLAWREGA